MIKTVLLNDTSGRFHHGCSRVMRTLHGLLDQHGITVEGAAPAHQDWRKDSAFLNALDRSDLIVINGEGTLHDAAPKGQVLLDILNDPRRQDRPVALINALWQDNPPEWTDLARQCDIVSVRDSRSAQVLRAAGLPQVGFVPDLSLAEPAQLTEFPRNGLIVGDSVRLSVRKTLARVAQAQQATYLPTKVLSQPIWKNKLALALLWRAYNQRFSGPMPRFRMARDEAAYLSALSKSSGHISGRFHGICLSMVAETPFLAVASKTSKVETLLTDAGLGHDRLITTDALEREPSQTVPPFTETERKNIRQFRDQATQGAQELFAQIARLA